MKYPRENNMYQQNTLKKKSWTHEIHARKKFGPTHFGLTKYPRRHNSMVAHDSKWHESQEI